MATSKQPPDNLAPDPLGMLALKDVVSELIRLRDRPERPERWSSLVDRLEVAFGRTAELYEMLRDRYLLLKRHNAQLADELGWLRDQVDDLASLGEDGPASTAGPGRGRPRRRFEDRGRR